LRAGMPLVAKNFGEYAALVRVHGERGRLNAVGPFPVGQRYYRLGLPGLL